MYNTLLVLVDGSESSNQAVKHAAITAKKWDAKLKLMTVVAPPLINYINKGNFSNDYIVDFEKAIMSYHLSVLEYSKEMVKELCPTVKVVTQIKKGNVIEKILEASEEKDIDLVFIGSRGLGGFNGSFLGGVSNQVIGHCKKPIMVIK